MNFRKAESPAPAAYAANSRFATASADRRISVRLILLRKTVKGFNMYDFSFEDTINKIHNTNSKEYFLEAYRSYISGNNRACTVMLWSIVVYDVISKLTEMESIYSDSAASKALTELKKFQTDNPKNSEWELNIVEKIFKEFELIDIVDFETFQHIQKIRHLCAHPVITNNFELFNPDSDRTKSLLRSVLNGLLIKPPYLTKKIFETLIEDIAKNSDLLIDPDVLNRYLDSRYLNKMSSKSRAGIFKTLWKIVFRLENEECNINRDINFKTLKHVFNKETEECIKEIGKDKEYFSKFLTNENIMLNLIIFLGQNNKIYRLLTEAGQLLIRNYKNSNIDVELLKSFTCESIDEYIQKVNSLIETNTWSSIERSTIDYIFTIFYGNDRLSDFVDIAIKAYVTSGTFDTANYRFDWFVKKYFDHFLLDKIKVMIEGANCNSQVYYRRYAKSDHKWLKEKIEQKYPNLVDYSQFNNVFEQDE
jgi:hypothetical protein